MVYLGPESPPVSWRLTLTACWRAVALLGVVAVGLWTYAFRPANRSTTGGRARWLSRTCEHALRVLRVRVDPIGPWPHGVMLTPNHVSYLDILILASLGPTVFVAKAEVKGWPLFGWFAHRAGTLFIRREQKSDLKRVGEQLSPVLDAGVNLVVFLEGTSSDGNTVRAFRPGLLEPIVQLGAAAVPVTISYEVSSGYDASVDVAWWGTMPLVAHLVTLIGIPRIGCRVVLGEAQRGAIDRKVLAAHLHREVRAALPRPTET